MHARSLGRNASPWLIVSIAAMCCAPVRVSGQARENYEEQRLDLFLNDAGLVRDPAPEGKTIRYVRFERRQVLEPDDLLVPVLLPRFASTWTNIFHWLSEESLVRRELLLRVEAPFNAALAAESERNLRALSIFALVRVVAVQTRDPSAVGVVVYTRDLWSLRFEQYFDGAGTTFTLGGQLVERNLFGRGKLLAVRASLKPLTYSAGETYIDPRVWQTDLRASESIDLIFNRRAGKLEGSTGTFRFGRPLRNLEQQRAFGLLAYYLHDIYRAARGDRVLGVPVMPSDMRPFCFAGEPDCLARVWDERHLQLDAAADYRVGERYKQTFTLGATLLSRHYAANGETQLMPELRELFATTVLPTARRDVYPYLRYRLSLPRFVSFENLGTFARAESVQVGPILDGQIGVPLRAYGASSDGMLVHGLMGYVWAARDSVIDVAVEGEARLEQGRVLDQHGTIRLRGATPSYASLLGRFVFRAYWDVRRYDSERTLVALGGDQGLRGYGSTAFFATGGNRFLWNLEFRSRPVVVQSVHVGAIAFYDAGSVYERLTSARVHQAVGAGLRVLLPQFNPYAFRLDVGLPLGEPGYAVNLSYGGDQVVALTPEEDVIAAAGRRQSLVQ